MPTYDGADGAPLHYDVFGAESAAPLIVLAGGAARHPEYLGDLASLSDDHRLIVAHLRGVGASAGAELGDGAGSWWRQADDVDRLRASLGLERCTVLAHSAGTRVAIAYAAQFPERVAALVLITPPAGYLVDEPSDSETLEAARAGEPAFAAALTARDAGPDTSSDETFNAWQRAIAPLCYARWDDAAQAHAGRGAYSLAAAQAFFSVDPPADLPSRLAELAAPTLVVAGGQDVITGRAPVEALADRFGDSRLAVLEQCGHVPWVEQPAAFRAAVDPFLARQF